MSNSTTTQITGNFGGAYPDGITLDNVVVQAALEDATALKTGTTANETFLLQAYDVNGTAYKTFATFTAADTPLAAFVQPSGGLMTWEGGIIGGVTPAAGTFTTLASTGAATFASATVTANLTITGYTLESVGAALSGAGTTRADATQLAKQINNVTTAASGTGVILPVGVVGMRITVLNAGANALKVYATASETIDGTAGATGVALTNAKRADFIFTAANTWISYQLGVPSA